jgi:hypothetical protein
MSSIYKILVTARAFDYSSAGYHDPAQNYSHQVNSARCTAIALESIEFPSFLTAEIAVAAISAAGHMVTRLYKLPQAQ